MSLVVGFHILTTKDIDDVITLYTYTYITRIPDVVSYELYEWLILHVADIL